METALAEREDFKITADDVRKYFAPTATEKEFGILMGICKSFQLNPFKREVHFVKYGSAPASIITGYEIYLKRAERTGKLDGWKCWIEDMGKPTERAVIEIKRKDQSTHIKWEVYRNEFDKKQSTWKAMPTFMLKKVAIAQGFRLAFPDDLGGMPYIPEEMPNDKGGGVSETLPKGDVIDAVPEPPHGEEPPPESYPEFDQPPEPPPEPEPDNRISDKQRKRFYAIAKSTGFSDDEMKAHLKAMGIEHSVDIRRDQYEGLCKWAAGEADRTPGQEG